jgi:hypothetical protein
MRALLPLDHEPHGLTAPHIRPPQGGRPYVTSLSSNLDLCPACSERVIKATGCENQIEREIPRPAQNSGPTTALPTNPAASDTPAKTGWELLDDTEMED